MTPAESLTCQDWYRVRRGEDQIAWGQAHTDPELPRVIFSKRASQEMAFLTPEQRQGVTECARHLSAETVQEHGVPVTNGGGRRLMHAGSIRVVFRPNASAGQIEISTIRGGKVLDPENVDRHRRLAVRLRRRATVTYHQRGQIGNSPPSLVPNLDRHCRQEALPRDLPLPENACHEAICPLSPPGPPG